MLQKLKRPHSISIERQMLLVILAAWGLLFFAHSWEAGLKLDGMTYSTIARNILLTGDWSRLHYSDYLYPDFYQHPPLAFWCMALVFKCFGISILTVKTCNAIFALFTLLTVNKVGSQITRSPWGGFLAALVLLTSTRWVKFGSDFYLDNLLSLFLMLGLFCILQFIQTQGRSRLFWAVLYGVCLVAALLTKGLVALALPCSLLVCAIYYCWAAPTVKPIIKPILKKEGRDLFVLSGIGVLVAGLILTGWIICANGLAYLRAYWDTSVAYRLTAATWSDHWVPLQHILTVWWPWWPFFFWGTLQIFQTKIKPDAKLSLLLAMTHAWAILIGFSLVGHSIEFYFLPFYVFSSLIVGWVLYQWKWLAHRQIFCIQAIQHLCFWSALVLATCPLTLHKNRTPELEPLVKIALNRCGSSRSYSFLMTPEVGYIWHNLAYIQWTTPWQSFFPTQIPKAFANQLLVIHQKEQRSEIEMKQKGWTSVPTLMNHPLRLYEPTQHPICVKD